jgi:hypothetical protein
MRTISLVMRMRKMVRSLTAFVNINLTVIFQKLSLSKRRSWILARRQRPQRSLQLILAASFKSSQSRSRLKNLRLRWKGGIELHQELLGRWKETLVMSW